MISALAWIKKGAAKQFPDKYTLSEEEYKRISNLTEQQVNSAKEDLNNAIANENTDIEIEPTTTETPANNDDELAEYNLDDYDKEVDNKRGPQIFSNLAGLTYYSSNKEDPYITLDDAEDEKEEMEELEVLPTDNLLITAKTEDDISHLEIYTYIEEEDNLYIHHDIMLPAFPLCVEWLDFKLGRKAAESGTGNYVAIGTFDPTIEIWDLDTIDAMYPDVILGEPPKKRGKKNKKINNERHTAAVMGLSWNKAHRNLLASSSADTTVKLWDIQTAKCMHSYNHHTDKVQAVQWNPSLTTALLTGSYDKRVCAFDSRSPEAISEWKLTADVECLKWNPHKTELFYVSTEDGLVKCFDARQSGSKELFTLQAHDGPVSALDVNPLIPDCIMTGSVDKQVRIWNIANNQPTCVLSRNLDVGKVFAASFSLDSPFLAAVSGSKGKVAIWNTVDNATIRNTFGDRVTLDSSMNTNGTSTTEKSEVVTLPDDKEPESDSEEEGEKGMEVDDDDEEEDEA
ncbi:WD40 repeat-like protein [Neocallimastix lanati (nom. inval.)]|jgi:periodic tryptophan protein 1|uniref:WD40 repeat-like protein n=1 Tax=Neocallimastix californiae TaxID=1754190 RepID=A0A1Y2D418_9FUNG|nr:WD40 repeat-like protein [Neocallimastix sp. JGI-2020a]ORY54039.1 WD40 repeat-like protein [Neocallimastix californiae]|eukprot:ORY54039.1 WD40 repeat-like protein [Neocallimastix californiae]